MKKLICLLALVMLVSGCGTTRSKFLFGIGMNGVHNAKDFKFVQFSSNEGWSYKYNKNTMNKNICARGYTGFQDWQFNITVTNNTNAPIATNYFGDSFALTTIDGKVFHIEKGDILSYPTVGYINPGKTVSYPLNNPFGFDKKRLLNETAMIVCKIGTLLNKKTIVLKPFPRKTP